MGLLATSSGDGAFSSLRLATKGLAGIRTAKIINFACRCMSEDEFYLEVGTFCGYTLLSAGYQNNALCIGVDDFSLQEIAHSNSIQKMKPHVRNFLQKNMDEFGYSNCNFFEKDFRDMELSLESAGKLAVLFIDGNHTYEDVKDALGKFGPYLSKEAVLVFDDVQYGNIPKAIQELWSSGEYEMLLYGVSAVNEHDKNVHKNRPLDEFVSNGICVMAREAR